jgi:hypothetical protein
LEGAATIGTRWAKGWFEEMRKDGRPIEGGWPGTLPEALARVAAYFELELARHGMPLLTLDETSAIARAAYQQAKREWLSMQKL